jgi:hypothetical protein
VIANGNVKIEQNLIIGFMLVVGNEIAGNLQAFGNRGPGDKTVQGNVVGESVQCFENDEPFVGAPNTASKSEGQCAPPP